jgi:glutamate carboxypeptidase
MPSNSERAAELLSYFEEHRGDLLDFIRSLVEQESMSRVPEATLRIAENLGDWLAGAGATVDILRDARYGGTVRARIGHEVLATGPAGPREAEGQGKSKEFQENKQLLVVGHLDTVWPIGTLAGRPFRLDGDQAFGPGIFDMKAGVAIASFALRAMNDTKGPSGRPITFLMTCDEETGSHFSREVIEDEARSAHAALVLEPPIPGGKVKTGRKGVGEFELIVRGRPAHAGNDPRNGLSAITELAHQILAINAMNDYERGTTLNVGVVSGGVLSNVVAAEARASIDMRFRTVDEGVRIAEQMSSLQPVAADAGLEVRGGINRPPLERTPQIGALFEHAKRLAGEIGFPLAEGSVGGGSDGNFIAALGVPVLDGLGVDGAGAHAEHEHIIVSDIPRRAALITRLIQTV